MTLDMDTDLSLALERLRNARTSRDKRDILLELKVRPPQPPRVGVPPFPLTPPLTAPSAPHRSVLRLTPARPCWCSTA